MVSLEAQLESAHSQLSITQSQSREKEDMLTQQIEALKQDNIFREKDLQLSRCVWCEDVCGVRVYVWCEGCVWCEGICVV